MELSAVRRYTFCGNFSLFRRQWRLIAIFYRAWNEI